MEINVNLLDWLANELVFLEPAYGLIPSSLAAGIQFQSQRERSYFRLYQDQIASELAGGFDATLWNQIILQACENPAIFALTTATAALKQASNVEQSGSKQEETKMHREEALKQYGKALKGIRNMLSKVGEDDLRIVLIAAILIFCIENMNGHTRHAVKHIQTALHFIRQKLRERFEPNGMDTCPPFSAVSVLTLRLSRNRCI